MTPGEPGRPGAVPGPPAAAEDLGQDRAAGADRIAADLLFFLADHQVQAVERLVRDVLLDVRVLTLRVREGIVVPGRSRYRARMPITAAPTMRSAATAIQAVSGLPLVSASSKVEASGVR